MQQPAKWGVKFFAAAAGTTLCISEADNEVWRRSGRKEKKEAVLIAKDQTASKPVISAYTIWYAGVARSTVRLLGRRRPTSKLCLFLRVMVPITPMGDAHLLIYVYHKSRQMSRTFCKKYIGLRRADTGVLLISTEQVQKTVETPYFVQKFAQNTECRMRQKTRGDGQNNCELFMSGENVVCCNA